MDPSNRSRGPIPSPYESAFRTIGIRVINQADTELRGVRAEIRGEGFLALRAEPRRRPWAESVGMRERRFSACLRANSAKLRVSLIASKAPASTSPHDWRAMT